MIRSAAHEVGGGRVDRHRVVPRGVTLDGIQSLAACVACGIHLPHVVNRVVVREDCNTRGGNSPLLEQWF